MPSTDTTAGEEQHAPIPSIAIASEAVRHAPTRLPTALSRTGWRRRSSPVPPGPRSPMLLQTFWRGVRPFEQMDEMARRYGDCFTLHIVGSPPQVFFSHPDAIKQILSGDPETLRGGENAQNLAPILGQQSIVLLDEPHHQRVRRLMLPPFHRDRIQLYASIMLEVTDRVIDAWPLDRPFSIQAAMQEITLEIILRAVFGMEEGETFQELRAGLLRDLELAEHPLAPFFSMPIFRKDLGPWSPWGRFLRHVRDVDAIFFAEIARRRKGGTNGGRDVVSMLLEARDEAGEPMGDQELRDQMYTLLMAGHETTATSLAWAIYHVLTRPDVLERIRAELADVVGGGPIEPSHVGRLPYIDAVIKETARLTPVITDTGRLLRVPMRLGDRDLPAGVIAMASIYLAHRRPDLWTDPDRFDPDRFLDSRTSPYVFLPFGGGERRCIGAAFANYEMKIVLAQLLSRVDLRLRDGYRPRPLKRAVTVGPSGGVPVSLTRRTPS